MDKPKRTTISISANETLVEMTDLLRSKLGYESRASVMKEAIRRMYKVEFPAYAGRPTPINPETTAKSQVAAAKSRVTTKQIQSQAEREVIEASGRELTRILSGRITGESGGLDTLGCVVTHQLDSSTTSKTRELTSPILLKDMPTLVEDIMDKSEYQAQAFVLELKFRDLDLGADPARLLKKLTQIKDVFLLALERKTIKPENFTREVCQLLINRMEAVGVEVDELKEELEINGFFG